VGFLSATLGRIAPQYRTLREWSVVYDQIISTRPFVAHTLSGRRNHVKYIVAAIGGMSMRDIRPHNIALLIRDLHEDHPQTARRVLIEARDMFNEAINYGWLDRNPANEVKHLPAPVLRQRMSLEQWWQVYDNAHLEHWPPWARHMLALALVSGQRRADLQKMVFDDVWDGHLHVEQQKTGARIALPLKLRLDAADLELGGVIEACRDYAAPGQTLLRKRGGGALVVGSLSSIFTDLRTSALGKIDGPRTAPSLHEIRSLSERLYRAQGIDTQTLLGHKRQAMTDVYNDDRGLSRGQCKVLQLP